MVLIKIAIFVEWHLGKLAKGINVLQEWILTWKDYREGKCQNTFYFYGLTLTAQIHSVGIYLYCLTICRKETAAKMM